MRSIVCPNCGANATNHRNCEYCGSLLVRFEDQHLPYQKERYLNSHIVETPLGDNLSMHLITARQPGIGGVCTHLTLGAKPPRITLNRRTVCYVMNGDYYTVFGLDLIDPASSKEIRDKWYYCPNDPYEVIEECDKHSDTQLIRYKATKHYDLSSKDYLGKTFILILPFIGFSNNQTINSTRWELSTNLIKESQLVKMRLLRKDFSKLFSKQVYNNDDYSFELWILDLGEDLQGATSIIAQISDGVLHNCGSFIESVPASTPNKFSAFFKKFR